MLLNFGESGYVKLSFNQNSKIMKLFEELEQLVAEARKDAESFYSKGNKAAGTRLRKAMQEAKNKAQDIRKEVTDKKNEA